MLTIDFQTGSRATSLNSEAVDITEFKGGEVNIRLSQATVMSMKHARATQSITEIKITARITNSTGLMALMLTVDAVRRIYPSANICAYIPYFPYARQDRVCNPGEALSVAVAAKMVNSLNLKRVEILDPHSSVTPALIDNVVVREIEFMVSSAVSIIRQNSDITDLYYVAPDQGAYKKVFDLAARNRAPGFISAVKTRNPRTMEIENMWLVGDVKNKDLLIIDDICDGGRTFLELGKLLKENGAASIHLFVTHGIFSYGTAQLSELFDGVYTSTSFTNRDSVVNSVPLARENIHWLGI